MLDLTTYLRRIMNQDAAETFDQTTDSLEAIANALGIGPSVGLWMFGVCDPAMVASTTNIVTNNLVGLPDDIFNDQFYMQIIRNTDIPGAAPEGEIRQITGFVGATQAFTVNAFTANVEADDLICIIHESLITPGLEVISAIVQAIFDLVNAQLVLTETGGTVTATGLLTEDNVYINNAPAGVFKPHLVTIDMSDLAVGEVATVRVRYRIEAGGALELKGAPVIFNGVQAEPLKDIELTPNRFGVQVTIEATAAVVFPWEVHYEV